MVINSLTTISFSAFAVLVDVFLSMSILGSMLEMVPSQKMKNWSAVAKLIACAFLILIVLMLAIIIFEGNVRYISKVFAGSYFADALGILNMVLISVLEKRRDIPKDNK